MTDQEFISICKSAKSMAEACQKTGMTFTTFKVKATDLNCYDNRKGMHRSICYNNSYEKLMEILDGKHPTFQPYKLKQLLFKHKVKENKCERCGIDSWQDQPIECQLHHKDGNKYNHSLENLEILCPNCHSQTETFCFKRGKKYKKS